MRLRRRDDCHEGDDAGRPDFEGAGLGFGDPPGAAEFVEVVIGGSCGANQALLYKVVGAGGRT